MIILPEAEGLATETDPGIITYAPCGRKQQPYIYPDGTRSKPMGRNELISAVIVEVTGDARVRKQISSHLQVVRAKLAADPWCMYSSCNDLSTYRSHVMLTGLVSGRTAYLARRRKETQ